MEEVPLEHRIREMLGAMGQGVTLCAVVKGRSDSEIDRAIAAGISVIGSNYAQETTRLRLAVKGKALWRFIGHLQSNKIRDLVPSVDTVDTVDRPKIAKMLNDRAGELGRTLPVLIEINSGREPQKSGVFPEGAIALAESILSFPHLTLSGVMTMGPAHFEGEKLRPFFAETRECLRRIQVLYPTAQTLSMGMTGSWQVALSEGANLIRLGSHLFGPRPV